MATRERNLEAGDQGRTVTSGGEFRHPHWGDFMGLRLSAARAAVLSMCSALSVGVFAADTLIRDVRIEFADGRVIEKGMVWIRDGRIQDVGPALSVPGGPTVIEGAGLTVYPGFIDAYSTRGLKLPAAPAAGTPPSASNSAPPTMWAGNRKGIRTVRAAECLDLGTLAGDARSNGITAAYLCPGGGIIRGIGALALMTDEKQTAKDFGLELSFRGVGGGPGGGGGGGQGAAPNPYPGGMLGYIALLRQTLYDAKSYSQYPPAKEDPDLKAISTVFSGTAAVAADTAADLVRAISLADEFNLKTLIVGGREAYRLADQIAPRFPVAASVSIGSEPRVSAEGDTPAGVQEDRREAWKSRAGNIAALVAGGVKVALSSDGDGASSYLANVRKLIALGLNRGDALKAMTSTPAEVFGMADWGEIAAGKAANLTIMDGDFADPKTKVKFVFVNGKKFEVSK